MKTPIFYFKLFTSLATVLPASLFSELYNWQNVEVIQEGVEKPHATMMTYPSQQQALKNIYATAYTGSPWYQSLNGKWHFNWSKNPASRPLNFWQTDYDTEAWKSIQVPSNWSKFGYGMPIYVNSEYPFPDTTRAPNAPTEYNPVGSYVRTLRYRRVGENVLPFFTLKALTLPTTFG